MFSSTFSLFLILPSLFCSLTFIESLHCLHGARLMIEQQTLIGFWDRLWHRFQELPKYHHTSLFTTSLHKLSDEPTFGNDSKNCHQGHRTSLFSMGSFWDNRLSRIAKSGFIIHFLHAFIIQSLPKSSKVFLHFPSRRWCKIDEKLKHGQVLGSGGTGWQVCLKGVRASLGDVWG